MHGKLFFGNEHASAYSSLHTQVTCTVCSVHALHARTIAFTARVKYKQFMLLHFLCIQCGWHSLCAMSISFPNTLVCMQVVERHFLPRPLPMSARPTSSVSRGLSFSPCGLVSLLPGHVQCMRISIMISLVTQTSSCSDLQRSPLFPACLHLCPNCEIDFSC